MNDKVYLLDTSYIVALLSAKDVHHKKATTLFEENDGIFATHFLIYQETITILCRRTKEQKVYNSEILKKIRDFFSNLMMIKEIPPENDVMKIIENTECLLSFADATLLYYSNTLKADILTFDRNLLSNI